MMQADFVLGGIAEMATVNPVIPSGPSLKSRTTRAE
jgi:hypothetical protein